MEATKQYTVEEIERLPEDARFELLRGEALPVSPTGLLHLVVTGVLIEVLGAFVRRHRLGIVGGEAGFILPNAQQTLLAPDVAFVRRDRLPKREEWGGFVNLAPDLAVEVISPSDTVGEIIDKTVSYLDAGVRLVWVVDPRRRLVTAYTPGGLARVLRETDQLDGGDVVLGFAMPVADLFAGLDEAE